MDGAIVRWLNGGVGRFAPLDALMEVLVSDYFVPVTGSLLLLGLWLYGRGADRLGNLVYRLAGRNFNTLMATAAGLVIAEVEEIVEPGVLGPETIGTPAVYVDRLVRCDPIEVRWYG